jgi:undecaprenyl diphosphate synthase
MLLAQGDYMNLESIAFIPDGNRRYAARNGMDLAKAYQVGTHRTWDVIQWLSDYPKIKAATFYALSLENITRSKTELNILFKIFEKEADKILAEEYYKTHGFAIRFLGRLESFPKNMQNKMNEIQNRSQDYAKRVVNVAIGYNGRTEIVDAAKKLAHDFAENKVNVDTVTEETFRKYLIFV